MCELPIKEDVFAGFAGEMENTKTEGEEDGGWMLSAYCGTEVLKKEFFYTLGKNSVSKPPERYNTAEQQSVFVSGSTQTPGSSAIESKNLGTATDSSGSDSNMSAQASAAARPLTIRKRTASYAFVSSEPESNNNKSQYDDAYGTVEAPKLPKSQYDDAYGIVEAQNFPKSHYDDAYGSFVEAPNVPRLSSAETYEETTPQGSTTYEDKDYIFENPYLIEYRDYNGETEMHEGKNEVFNFNQKQQQGQDEQFVQDMEYRSGELIRQRNCSDLSNQDTLIVIKEMKKTADFTMGEYNALATDLNRDVNEFSRGGRRKSPTQVEWWRITRHLELTCEYVILKLRNELRVDPRTNTRIKTFSSRGGGNITQTLLSMSMGGGGGGKGGPPARRNSDTLTKQQLNCVNDLKDLVKRVLHPKHCKRVKIGAIVSLFYTIKQKFQLDHYEAEIIDYGIETMRQAMKNNQQADSPEVVRCVQEVCDLVKQMVMVRNSFSSAPNIHRHHTQKHVPSLLDIQVTPPIKSRLFNKKLGKVMKLTLNCLMKLYKHAEHNDDSNTEPKPSTSSASDDDNGSHSADPFSLDLPDHTTFPSASDSSSPSAEDLPVINTFSLGSTYDYSKENENKTEAMNEEEEGDKDDVARDSSPGDSVDRSQTAANDSPPSPQISDPVPRPHHSSEDHKMLQQDVSDADNIVPKVEEFSSSSADCPETAAASSETACGDKDAVVKEEAETDNDDNETSTATESKAASVAQHEDNVAEEKTAITVKTDTRDVDDNNIANTTAESKATSVAQHEDNVAEEKTAIVVKTETSDVDDNNIATTKIEVENVVENEGNEAAENCPLAACQSGNKSANVLNQYGDYQGCPPVETDSIETILEKTFPIEQDYVAEVDLSRDNGNVECRQKDGTSRNAEETGENFAVQNEMALDLSMHKDDSNQDNGEKN